MLETVIVDGKNKYGPITFSTELGRPSLIIHNIGLHMFPLLQKKITSESLNVSCSDLREVYFFIKKYPSYGKLVRDQSLERITNFTQSDINNQRISYQHIKAFKNSSLMDFFIFDISASHVEPIRDNVSILFISFYNI